MMEFLPLITAALLLLSGGEFALPSVYESAEVMPDNAFSHDDDIVGADWRTWGTIDAYGKINPDGDEIDLCVCLFADRAELYYNEESQRLYKTLEYPKKLTTEQYKNSDIFFEDYNSDGFIDIRVTVKSDGDTGSSMIWVCDSEDFVYRADIGYTPQVPVILKPEVSAEILQDGKISLKWEKVTGAKKYAIYRKVSGKLKKIVETTKTSVTVKPDNSGNAYAVKAYADGKWTKIKAEDIVTAVYTDESLISMAKKYYKASNGSVPAICEINTRDEHIVTIHLYEEIDDGEGNIHCTTYAWYTVDDRTGKGTDDIFGKKIDLTKTHKKS